MAYCYEKAIPHSFFLGGEHVWTQDDREKAMAFAIERSERCTMCGTASWEWEADRYAFEPMVEICIGCRMKDLMRDDAKDPGASIVLVPKDQAAKMREQAPAHGPRSGRG